MTEADLRADLADPAVVDFYARFTEGRLPWEMPFRRINRPYHEEILLYQMSDLRKMRGHYLDELAEHRRAGVYDAITRTVMQVERCRWMLAGLNAYRKELRG